MNHQFRWDHASEIVRTDEGIAFMTTYLSPDWKERNEIGEEFDLQGQFLRKRYVERFMLSNQVDTKYGENSRELAEKEYENRFKNNPLFSISTKQKAAKMLGDILQLSDPEVEITDEGNMNNLFTFIKFKLGGSIFVVIKVKDDPPKIEGVHLDTLTVESFNIRTLFSVELEQLIIQKVIANVPKLRLKWLF